ncbi:MAG TPA: molybdenum cofactor guanylyltransferase [Candidatus Obscuribacterales bacterium]
MNPEALPVYLLAGGRSSRFGSDKARALLGGSPLILQVARLLSPYAADLKVVAASSGAYADLGLETLADTYPAAGPLGGLYTALSDCRTHAEFPWLLLASCDCWGVRPDQLETLLRAPRTGCLAVAFKTSHWQPLWALYHTDLLAEVETRLSTGQGALWHLLDAVSAQAIELGSDPGWIQINRPVELERANRRFPGQDTQLGPEPGPA